MAIPKGADIFYQGSFYKISCTDQVFIYVNGDWILSSRSVGEIRNAILCEKKGTSTSASTKKKVSSGENPASI